MNILEYIDFLNEQEGYTEEAAEKCAEALFCDSSEWGDNE